MNHSAPRAHYMEFKVNVEDDSDVMENICYVSNSFFFSWRARRNFANSLNLIDLHTKHGKCVVCWPKLNRLWLVNWCEWKICFFLSFRYHQFHWANQSHNMQSINWGYLCDVLSLSLVDETLHPKWRRSLISEKANKYTHNRTLTHPYYNLVGLLMCVTLCANGYHISFLFCSVFFYIHRTHTCIHID